MEFREISISDNDRYQNLLKRCQEIPSDIVTSYSYGYDAVFPGQRAYWNDLCWHKLKEDGTDFFYPPVGDWDKIDWHRIFENMENGTRFAYVPRYLKEKWESLYPGRFDISTDRGTWDYIYDMSEFVSIKKIKHHYNGFINKYPNSFYPIDESCLHEIAVFTEKESKYKKSVHSGDYRVMNEDNTAMLRMFEHWNDLPLLDGVLVRIGDEIISYLIWEKVDRERVVALFNKNSHTYSDTLNLVLYYACLKNLYEGRRYINCACDADDPGIRNAKMLRRPMRLLEKYNMIWRGYD